MIKAGTDAGVFRIRTGFYLVLARLCDLMHFQLGHDQAVIYAFFRLQLIMGADFRHRMLIDDDNPIRLSQGGEPMGNGKGGAILCQPAERFLNLEFGFGIQAAGGLVQNQQMGIVENSAAMAIRCLSPPESV